MELESALSSMLAGLAKQKAGLNTEQKTCGENITVINIDWSKEFVKQSSELRTTFTCNNTLNEGWCETFVWDFTSHKNKNMQGGVRLWCQTLVWDFGVRIYIRGDIGLGRKLEHETLHFSV